MVVCQLRNMPFSLFFWPEDGKKGKSIYVFLLFNLSIVIYLFLKIGENI